MYPFVELKIKDGVPHIVYYPAEGQQKHMTLSQEKFIDAAMHGAKKLELLSPEAEHNQENLENLLRVARESDESYYTELPDVDTDSVEFKLIETLKPYLQKMTESTPEDYSDLDMTDEVKEELERFRNSDFFASYMEALYSILIAKTLLAAHDLGIGKISLNDEFRNPRLMEKMSKELDKLGLELNVPELV